MPSLLVVHLLDKLPHAWRGIGQITLLQTMDLFVFPCFHKALGQSIVVRIPATAPADVRTGLPQQVGIEKRSLWNTAIGVVNPAWFRLPCVEGRWPSRDNELRLQAASERPAHHSSRVDVQPHRPIHSCSLPPDIRDVRDPELVHRAGLTSAR